MNMNESIRVRAHGDIAIMEWDLVGEKVNKLNSASMTRFKELLEEIQKSSYKAMIIISRKPKIFIAGADIDEIRTIKTSQEFAKAIDFGHSVFNFLEDLSIPVIAAIHGACVGGGCEMALACDYRIASDDSSTQIGLPETRLGLIPGFGGCVRLPRTIGLQASLDIILAGKSVDSKKALKLGLIDQRVNVNILEDQALKMASELIVKGGKKRCKYFQPKGALNTFLESFAGRRVVFSQALKSVLKQTHGHYPAPLLAVEVIKKTYGMKDRAKALSIECEAFAKVALTDAAKHLINLFYLMEDVKKQTGVMNANITPAEVKRLGILGAGTMGGGVAYVAADKGIEVRMKDISHAALGLGYKAARSLWDRKLKRRRIDKYQFGQKLALVSGGLDYSGFKRLDVVIEAIVEDMEIKKKVIAETATHCRSEVIIATNTSSLSVNEMATAHPYPENFIGMHFFNPVDRMPLVEIIRGIQTSDQTTAAIFELAKKMGKIPVVVKDAPGFLVNRLLMPYMVEAIFLLQEGMAIDVVDKYYVKQLGMPMGPFALMDEVGLDVCLKVAKIFRKALGERVEIPDLLHRLAETKRLGKKNQKGFYLYDNRGKKIKLDETIYADLGLNAPTNPYQATECIERGIFPMINEAAMVLLTEKIVEKASDVDLAMIMGTGFPPFRGGLLRYADNLSTTYINAQLEMYQQKTKSQRFAPMPALRELAQSGKGFYS